MNYFFDLDGTLTDPGVGITRCIQHALDILGEPPREASDLLRYVGPPLHRTFEALLSTGDRERVSRAVAIYRERFVEVGMFENVIYPDVEAGLGRLTDEGHQLWVVTSKPHDFARQIVEHFGIRSFFRAVYGSELDGRNADKRNLIRIVLEAEYLAPLETWMIGDRAEDIIGGRANGTRTVGVLWGYGPEAEIRGEEPDAVIASMRELPIAD